MMTDGPNGLESSAIIPQLCLVNHLRNSSETLPSNNNNSSFTTFLFSLVMTSGGASSSSNTIKVSHRICPAEANILSHGQQRFHPKETRQFASRIQTDHLTLFIQFQSHFRTWTVVGVDLLLLQTLQAHSTLS
jgi:hypothetical protein